MSSKVLSAWPETPRMDKSGRPHYRASWHERQPDGTLRRCRRSLWGFGVRSEKEAREWCRLKSMRLNNVASALPSVTARAAFDEYLADFQFRANRKTQHETRIIIDRFLGLTGAGPRPLVEITKTVISQYLDKRLAGAYRGYDPVAPATRDGELRLLQAAFRRMCKPPFEFIGSCPTAGLLASAPPAQKDDRSGRLHRGVRRLDRWARGLVKGLRGRR
ncbi:MAG TPA: hypothetical protein VMY35_19175 [Phycisphaerae bacterium]|nr:hypothetical protein [Phycisphaerae bacterium]